LILRGSRHNTGDGIQMALAIGAQPAGQWGDYHSAVIDARSPRTECGVTALYNFQMGIIVDAQGHRFLDEGEDFRDNTYVKFGKAIVERADGLAFCLFDQQAYRRPEFPRAWYPVAPPVMSETLEELAKQGSIPVINGLTDWFHPVQALTDVYTMWEKFGDLKRIKVSFFGDATNVANSLLVLTSRLGMNFTFCGPRKYWPKERVMRMVEENVAETGANVEITEDIDKAIKDANVVYTDLWWWVGQEHEAEERKVAFQPYQVNANLMRKAAKNAVFMHCLPAGRGMEVTDEVMDGPWSIVWDQAENRLHVEKAILVLLMG
ncbi:MAG: hypothetical protein QW187_01125, partial [Candidatus Korarchaeum sp.]